MNRSACPHLEAASIRRRDRAVSDPVWIRELLGEARFGVLATVRREGDRLRPHLNPNLFVFDDASDSIYLHTARRGATYAAVAAAGEAAFCVAEAGELLPAAEAIHFSIQYSSVIATGPIEVVTGDEALAALEGLMRKYAPDLRPGRDYAAIPPSDVARTRVYRLRVETWTGKRNDTESRSTAAADEG